MRRWRARISVQLLFSRHGLHRLRRRRHVLASATLASATLAITTPAALTLTAVLASAALAIASAAPFKLHRSGEQRQYVL